MYIKVKVLPGAKKEEWKVLGPNSYIVSVREKAERGLANKRVQALIRDYFNKPNSPLIKVGEIRLVSGHQSTTKIFSLEEK